MTMQLKMAVGPEFIMAKEHAFMARVKEHLGSVKNLILLGNRDLSRLPVLSFVITHPETGLFLHYNFVCAILNDLFGIQVKYCIYCFVDLRGEED